MYSPYTPVEYIYRELVQDAIAQRKQGKIFYFGAEGQVEEAAGMAQELQDRAGEGLFIVLNSGEALRLDRIITLFGKPGAAYDEYNAFANACLDCRGDHGARD